MPLSIDGRHCGDVYVFRVAGDIILGHEVSALEKSISRASQEFLRFVVDMGDVTRVDSTGLGMLVRFLSHARNRGGDLRLASPPPFVVTLLNCTKLSTIFRVYSSEEDAIVSFLKEPRSPRLQDATAGPLVLFVDQSADLCAFVRTLLQNNGYEVLSTCSMGDARTLASASRFDYLVLGPDSSKLPCADVLASLKALAPRTTTLQLEPGFKIADPDHAGNQLLEMMKARAAQA